VVHDFTAHKEQERSERTRPVYPPLDLPSVHPTGCTPEKARDDAENVMKQLQGIVMIAWRLIARTERERCQRETERKEMSMRRVLLVHFCDCCGLAEAGSVKMRRMGVVQGSSVQAS
jgi:hypothetical protein